MTVLRRTAVGLLVALFVAVVGTLALGAHAGYRLYVVRTGSMAPALLPGDLVLDRPTNGPYAGQVITFRHSTGSDDVVTHRVTEVTAAGIIHTKGDANSTPDVWDIRPGQVEGAEVGYVRGLGYALVFLKQPRGAGAVVTIVIALVLLWSLLFPGPATRPAGGPTGRHMRGSGAVAPQPAD